MVAIIRESQHELPLHHDVRNEARLPVVQIWGLRARILQRVSVGGRLRCVYVGKVWRGES